MTAPGIQKPADHKPIPVPVSTPQERPQKIQAPVKLDEEEELPLELELDSQQLEMAIGSNEMESANLQDILLDKKSQKIETKTDKDTLFNIFSGKEVENTQVGANETPSPQQTPQNTLFKVLSAPDDQIIKPTPTPITIYPDEESGESEVIELTVDNEKEEKTTESIDPETLYQELINLEGKRYSLERSIRDLKRDRNSGKMSDNEYKSKLNKLLKDLKSISNRIEEIRENLD